MNRISLNRQAERAEQQSLDTLRTAASSNGQPECPADTFRPFAQQPTPGLTRALRMPAHLGISSLPVDIVVQPTGDGCGAKRSARIGANLGGAARNGGLAFVANGIPCGVLAAQDRSLLQVCRNLAQAERLRAFIIERHGVPPAVTISRPNGSPGGSTSTCSAWPRSPTLSCRACLAALPCCRGRSSSDRCPSTRRRCSSTALSSALRRGAP